MSHLTGTFNGIGVAPGVAGATMSGNVVRVVFTEPMSVTGLTTLGNYSIPGMTIQRVEIEPGSNDVVVLLTVTGFNPNSSYTVTVSNVTDKAGNTIA